MTTIYLIRHAEAEGNVYRRCHGIYDSGLTPKAAQQLPHLANRFADVPLDAIYASHLYRARHTAKAIADAKGMQVIIRRQLCEINMGDWEDDPWAELPRKYPEDFTIWRTRPWDWKVHGSETVMESGDRVLAELHRIAQARPEQNIAVVSHGSAIRSLLCRILDLTPEQIVDIGWGDNTCVAKLVFDSNGSVRAEYWNDASHLPMELSTFASIGWKNQKDIPSAAQIWFRPYDPAQKADQELFLSFVREQYRSAYGSDALLDAHAKLQQAAKASEVYRPAVSFGMLDDTPVALVFLDAADTSRPDTGMVGCYCIDAAYRGAGLSSQIIGQSLSVYRTLGRKYLCASVAEHNDRAIAFYHKFAFEQRGELVNRCGRHFSMYKTVQIPTLEQEHHLFDLSELI